MGGNAASNCATPTDTHVELDSIGDCDHKDHNLGAVVYLNVNKLSKEL